MKYKKCELCSKCANLYLYDKCGTFLLGYCNDCWAQLHTYKQRESIYKEALKDLGKRIKDLYENLFSQEKE